MTVTMLVDMDDTLVDFQKALVEEYNRRTDEGVERSQFKSWEMTRYVKQPELLLSIFREPGWFLRLLPMPGALETLLSIHENAQVEIVIASWPCTPHAAEEKLRWVQQWLPWLAKDAAMLGSKKHLLKADILVDDAYHFTRAYRQHWPEARIIGVEFPHNAPPAGEVDPFDFRVPNYTRPADAWGVMGETVKNWIEELA